MRQLRELAQTSHHVAVKVNLIDPKDVLREDGGRLCNARGVNSSDTQILVKQGGSGRRGNSLLCEKTTVVCLCGLVMQPYILLDQEIEGSYPFILRGQRPSSFRFMLIAFVSRFLMNVHED